jgi:hypothetical protein
MIDSGTLERTSPEGTDAAMTSDLERTPDFVDGEVSYWYRELGMPSRRAALQADADVDVAIVGGGLTG